ncbi:hypothetical protein [Paenibacillus humicus]|uniref:hypothetical protein n=1 Tax=Paenibacillus humicus TaxID=412861 RepID=UPI000FD70F2D|nr:hypothetical protein [Paenibacillus humicus]
MALIPLKQTITVTKAGESDGWGGVENGAVLTLPARVVNETKTVKTPTGEEAVTSLRITLHKLADISYDDTITFTDELGATIERKPLSIAPKRMLSGRAILTEVYV